MTFGDTRCGHVRMSGVGSKPTYTAPREFHAAWLPLPLASALTPSDVDAGSAGFTLSVTGTDFVPGSVVRWDGADRATTYVSSGEVQATVLAADLASQGTATVTVFNPAPGGGTSAGLTFTINEPPPTPNPNRIRLLRMQAGFLYAPPGLDQDDPAHPDEYGPQPADEISRLLLRAETTATVEAHTPPVRA